MPTKQTVSETAIKEPIKVWTEINFYNQDVEITPNCFEIRFLNQGTDTVTLNRHFTLAPAIEDTGGNLRPYEFSLTFPIAHMRDVTRFQIKFNGASKDLVVITRKIIEQ